MEEANGRSEGAAKHFSFPSHRVRMASELGPSDREQCGKEAAPPASATTQEGHNDKTMEAEAFGTDVGAVDREKVLGKRMRRVGGMEDLRGTSTRRFFHTGVS